MRPRTFISIIGFVASPVLFAGYVLAAEFIPPPGWELKSQGSKGSAYARGDCGLVVNELKSMNGSYKTAAEEYIDNAIKRLAEQGEQVVSMEQSTTLERTGAVTRSFVTKSSDGAAHINIRVVAEESGALRPITYRCGSQQSFKETWPGVGRAIVMHLAGPAGFNASQATDAGAPQKDRAASGGPMFLGVWHGANHLGQIHIHPDGTYSSPNGARGTWQATGERSVLFTSGPLTAWDGGRAKVSDKNALEFHWTSPTLGKQYFSYIRR